MNKLLIFTVIALFTGTARAQSNTMSPPPVMNQGRQQMPNGPMGGPCGAVVDACKQAGYVYGEAKIGKGLFKDCVGVVRKTGQAPTANPQLGLQAVTLTSPQIQACQSGPNRMQHGNQNGRGHPPLAPGQTAPPAPPSAPGSI